MFSPLLLATPFPHVENIELTSMEEEIKCDFTSKGFSLSRQDAIYFRDKLSDMNLLRLSSKRANNLHDEAVYASICGILNSRLYDADNAIEDFTYAQKLFHTIGDIENKALCLHFSSCIYFLASFKFGNPTLFFNSMCGREVIDDNLVLQSLDSNEEFLNILPELNQERDSIRYLVAYHNMGLMHSTLGQNTRAAEFFRDALTIVLSLPTTKSNSKALAMIFCLLGITLCRCNKFVEAKDSLYDSLSISQKNNYDDFKIFVLINFGQVFEKEGDLDTAYRYLKEAQHLATLKNYTSTTELVLLKLKHVSKETRMLGN